MSKNLLLFLISSLGIIAFLLVTSLVPFKSKLFSILYNKPLSQAAEGPSIPSVELLISNTSDKVLNVNPQDTPVTLSWKTSNVVSCIGRVWGLPEKDISFAGPKDPSGGSFQTSKLTKNNPYIYTIDCANEFGDAAGDGVVINVGALKNAQVPYITSFDVVRKNGEKLDSAKSMIVAPGEEIEIRWSTLNLSTPYSLCFATGSFPTQYLNVSRTEVVDKLLLADPKVYRYSLFCSNEAGITKKVITLTPL